MTAALTVRTVDRQTVGGVVLILAGLALLVGESHLRSLEAVCSAAAMRTIGGTNAGAYGSSVIFARAGRSIGYDVTTGCTSALLIAPFFLIGAGLLIFRKLHLSRTLVAVVAVSVLIWLVNQLRLLLIGLSINHWGALKGYNRTHILAGGVLSTVGVTIGVVVFLALLLGERDGGGGQTSHRP